MLEASKAEKLVNLLVANIINKVDYYYYSNGDNESKRIMIVEGETDIKFIKKIGIRGVLCEKATKAFMGKNGFGESSDLNNKKVIEDTIRAISKYAPVLRFPKDIEQWQIYGMIDADFEERNYYSSLNKLFVTDTHDLETLIMYSDPNVFDRIEKCVIKTDEVKRALYMAYQLGKYRYHIQNKSMELNLDPIAAGKEIIKYQAFTNEEYRMSLRKLISYLNERADNKLPPQRINKLSDKLCKDKSIKNELDSEGWWKKTLDDFDIENISDFWRMVNGHDVLGLIRYQNDDADRAYYNPKKQVDRSFEIEIINKYLCESFRNTLICSDMISEKIPIQI